MIAARAVALAVACLASSACGGGSTIVPVQQQVAPPRVEGGCPLGVPDAKVAVEDTYGGVALTFTSKDHAAELRDRSRDVAMNYGPGQHMGRGHGGSHGHGGGHGLQATQLPPAYATWASIEGGARIQLVPEELADINALRSKTRAAASRMSTICD